MSRGCAKCDAVFPDDGANRRSRVARVGGICVMTDAGTTTVCGGRRLLQGQRCTLRRRHRTRIRSRDLPLPVTVQRHQRRHQHADERMTDRRAAPCVAPGDHNGVDIDPRRRARGVERRGFEGRRGGQWICGPAMNCARVLTVPAGDTSMKSCASSRSSVATSRSTIAFGYVVASVVISCSAGLGSGSAGGLVCADNEWDAPAVIARSATNAMILSTAALSSRMRNGCHKARG